MTSPGRLYSSGRQPSREGLGNRTQGLEGLEVRDHQLKQLQQQCATAANKCRELQEALREKDGEVSLVVDMQMSRLDPASKALKLGILKALISP
jgi:hypothetical protein